MHGEARIVALGPADGTAVADPVEGEVTFRGPRAGVGRRADGVRARARAGRGGARARPRGAGGGALRPRRRRARPPRRATYRAPRARSCSSRAGRATPSPATVTRPRACWPCSRPRARRQSAQNASTTRRVELRPGAAAQLRARLGVVEHPAVGARLAHRAVGVADRDDARRRAGSPPARGRPDSRRRPSARGSPAPAPPPGERRRLEQHRLADLGVPAQHRRLVRVQRPGLAQDRVGDRQLADVVQLGRAGDDVARDARRTRSGRRRGARARRPRARARAARGRARRCARSSRSRSGAPGGLARPERRAALRLRAAGQDEAQRGYGASAIRNLEVIPCTHGH